MGSWWEAVQGILALVGFPVAILSWVRPWERTKRLAWDVVSSLQIIPRDGDALNLKVLHERSRVESPYVTLICIANTGHQAISVGDYDKPILIKSDVRVHAKAITACRPDVMEVRAQMNTAEGKVIKIAPLLLNRGDRFQLHLLTEGKPKLTVEARIVGETRKMRKADLERLWSDVPRQSATVRAIAVAALFPGPAVLLLDWLVRSGRLVLAGPQGGDSLVAEGWVWLVGGIMVVIGALSWLLVFAPQYLKRPSRR